MLKHLFTIGSNKILDIDLTGIDLQRVPVHVAIIMDGNGRWANIRGKARTFGHQAGAETLKAIVKVANCIGVKIITAYAFSTENWKRPVSEVDFLMNLLGGYLTNEIEEFNKNGVQLRFIGSRRGLPDEILRKMDYAAAVTERNTGIILNLAINYGGRDEILHAVKTIATAAVAGQIDVDNIDTNIFEEHLYTKGLPAPDLLIRPGGDMRISNFLLWQIAYTEIWTTDIYWPDFTQEYFIEAIKAYQRRERRFGGL